MLAITKVPDLDVLLQFVGKIRFARLMHLMFQCVILTYCRFDRGWGCNTFLISCFYVFKLFDKCASRKNLKTKNNKLAETYIADYMDNKIISFKNLNEYEYFVMNNGAYNLQMDMNWDSNPFYQHICWKKNWIAAIYLFLGTKYFIGKPKFPFPGATYRKTQNTDAFEIFISV